MPEARYANHFAIGHNEYEFVLDFTQQHFRAAGSPDDEMNVSRIVMGPAFARALLDTLLRAVGEYEQAHGPILRG